MNIEIDAAAVPKEERTWGMLCHLSALSGFIIPFGNFIGPLVVWLIKRDSMPFVDDQGKESLDFQITVFFAFIVCMILVFVVIGAFLAWALALYALVMIVIATVKANGGTRYRYPATLRLIK